MHWYCSSPAGHLGPQIPQISDAAEDWRPLHGRFKTINLSSKHLSWPHITLQNFLGPPLEARASGRVWARLYWEQRFNKQKKRSKSEERSRKRDEIAVIMVLTDRQRTDLHAGVHEYLLSRPGAEFAAAAEALAKADPEACQRNSDNADKKTSSNGTNKTLSSSAPVLEKKWTAVPRLQKKVLELERALSSIEGRGGGDAGGSGMMTSPAAMARSAERRNIPRPPAMLTLSGHTSIVTTVSLHPSYSLAASGSEDGTVKLWDVESGDLMKTLRGHTNTVTGVCFDDTNANIASKSSSTSAVCRLLASCSTDLSIKLWTWKQGSSISEWTCSKTLRGHDHTVSCVAFIPYANVGGSSNTSSSDESGAAIYLVSASRDTTIRVWEVSSGFCVQTFSGHSDWVRCLALTSVIPLTHITSNANGVIMASGSSDSCIKLWTIGGGVGESSSIGSSDAESESFAELRGHEHVIECLSFVRQSAQYTTKDNLKKQQGGTFTNKAGQNVLTLLVSGSRDKAVRLWNIATQECLMTFNVHENWVQSVILHPSGNYIISSGDDRSIRVLEIKVGSLFCVEFVSYLCYFANMSRSFAHFLHLFIFCNSLCCDSRSVA
jgi:platelet-activating factor acetylhydrolase IB subunit alpha